MQYVTDTSVIIEKAISKLIKEGKIEGTILLPKAVMAELENQANAGNEIGLIGLEEVQELQKLVKKGKIELKIIGERPTLYQIQEAKRGGEIDSYIRDLAYIESATLITADKIQAESAKALNIEVLFLEKENRGEKLEIEQFFDAETMSIHLRESCPPRAKKGKPGAWDLVNVTENIFSQKDIQRMTNEIIERSRSEQKAFIEISRPGSTIVQYKDYRIVITKTPVSDGWEITAVRPIKILKIEDYHLPEVVEERVRTKARGVIIAGTTGSGKSTIAQALAEYYASQHFITKTIESPRSLILSDNVTQYSKNLASSEEIHDILFLSRPDYIVFDEMRDTPDFKLFTDLRLGGSNVLGVLHAATPIDAVQRFMGRLEMGMIPSVLDTLLFIDKGMVSQILTLKMSVKVPSGMVEADLARPVIEVKDLTTDKVIFEIYTYGEQTVVMPLQKEKAASPAEKLAEKQIEKELLKYCDTVEVEMLGTHKVKVYVPQQDRARIIGTKGANIQKIEKDLGISIDVETLDTSREEKKRIGYHVTERGNNIIFKIDTPGKTVDVFIEETFLFTSTASKKGEIKLSKKSELGRKLSYALEDKEKIYIKG